MKFLNIKKWWQRVTDTKPKMPSVGQQRIRNERAQILTAFSTIDGETWEDLLTYADKNYSATCPKCKYRATLYDFKWNLDNPVVPLKKNDE